MVHVYGIKETSYWFSYEKLLIKLLSTNNISDYIVRMKNKWDQHFYFLTCYLIEHDILMVSYCGKWLSVIVRQHLMFTL